MLLLYYYSATNISTFYDIDTVISADIYITTRIAATNPTTIY